MNKSILIKFNEKFGCRLNYVSKRFKNKRQFTLMKESFELMSKLIPESYILSIKIKFYESIFYENIY